MKLPIEASDDDGILTKNGTMIYGKEDDAVTIGVQILPNVPSDLPALLPPQKTFSWYQ